MAFPTTRVQPWWCVIPSLCLLVFLFSLQAKLELYGRGQTVHPCNSSKPCLDARAQKLGVPRTVLARMMVSPDHGPTLHSEPVVEETFFVPVPRQLNLPYQRRLHRSPPVS